MEDKGLKCVSYKQSSEDKQATYCGGDQQSVSIHPNQPSTCGNNEYLYKKPNWLDSDPAPGTETTCCKCKDNSYTPCKPS